MSSKSLFYNGCQYVADRTCGGLINSLNWLGNGASFAGGTLNALAYTIDRTLTAGFALSANFWAMPFFNLLVSNSNQNLYQDFFFTEDEQTQGSFSVSFTDYLNPQQLQLIALCLVIAGIVLNSTGSTLKLLFSSFQDRQYYLRNEKKIIAFPNRYEYGHTIAEAITGSITMSLAISTLVQLIFRFTPQLNSDLIFTYPQSSDYSLNQTNYSGPAQNVTYGFTRQENRSVNIQEGPLDLPALVSVGVNASVDALYGAGIELTANPIDTLTLSATGAGTVVAYGASGFFSNKAKRARDRRLLNAQVQDSSDHESDDAFELTPV